MHLWKTWQVSPKNKHKQSKHKRNNLPAHPPLADTPCTPGPLALHPPLLAARNIHRAEHRLHGARYIYIQKFPENCEKKKDFINFL